jgi:hypothetical protein
LVYCLAKLTHVSVLAAQLIEALRIDAFEGYCHEKGILCIVSWTLYRVFPSRGNIPQKHLFSTLL